MKLPKQWRHWAKKAGLKPERVRGAGNLFYMIGRGRRWRVNCSGQFQCSCWIDEFDRWANSLGAQIDGIPQTEKQFLATVELLISDERHYQG